MLKRDETDKIEILEAKKRQLEAAFAKSTLDKFCFETLMEVAEETYGIDNKKLRVKSIEKRRKCMKTSHQGIGVDRLCGWCGYSRQGYLQHKRLVEKRQQEADVFFTFVRHFHCQRPRIGTES